MMMAPIRATSQTKEAISKGTAHVGQRDSPTRMHAALDKLPEHQRMVVGLGVLQELPYAEIAHSMNVPVGTIKSRMFHAVRKMRTLLIPVDDEAADGRVDSGSGDRGVLQ